MTKEREALKLALSTLNEVRSETFRLLRNGQKLYAEKKVWDTIFAIKEVLAQPEQEPVVIRWRWPGDEWNYEGYYETATWANDVEKEPLYTTPPQRTWVGLTDEDVLSITFNFDVSSLSLVVKAVEAKLKEKNT